MKKGYILSIDQSTQGTKALLFDGEGKLLLRRDKAHRQIINEMGWVSHDPEEIYANTLEALAALLRDSGIDRGQIAAVGISNQRETSLAWDRRTGKPVGQAVVWQCSRGEPICRELASHGEEIRCITGIPLSPYFPAAKYAWLIRNQKEAQELIRQGQLCLGTIDSFLVFRLTGGVFKTDYSNASRTQLFDLDKGGFSRQLCALFGIPPESLPQVEDSDGDFGMTDLAGLLPGPVPVCGVMGDSHAALFGQACLQKGLVKATYGTGSSIMMNVGDTRVYSANGLVSSVGFKIDHKISYVLEGNLNYTGAVVSWLKNDLKLIEKDNETQALAYEANPADTTCIVPAFSGLGAPYWNSEARAAIIGMTRTTGRAELVKAALSCIAQQIMDIMEAMQKDSGITARELRVDGGPTGNTFLMQLQSDLLGGRVLVPDTEELSGTGAAFAAGLAAGLYDGGVFDRIHRTAYEARMPEKERARLREVWSRAVKMVLQK